MSNAQDNAAHTCSYSCDRPECIKAQRDELAAAAAQEAVAWQRRYIGATRGNRPVEWHTITKDEFEATKAGKWADRYEVREIYAAPVTAAPVTVTRDADGEIVMVKQGDTIIASTCHAGGKAPAAPGIDLGQFRQAVEYWKLRWANNGDLLVEANRLLALIDASPKGGSEARDAERYRKLRCVRVNPYAVLPVGEELDAHVDAMKVQAGDAEVQP